MVAQNVEVLFEPRKQSVQLGNGNPAQFGVLVTDQSRNSQSIERDGPPVNHHSPISRSALGHLALWDDAHPRLFPDLALDGLRLRLPWLHASADRAPVPWRGPLVRAAFSQEITPISLDDGRDGVTFLRAHAPRPAASPPAPPPSRLPPRGRAGGVERTRALATRRRALRFAPPPARPATLAYSLVNQLDASGHAPRKLAHPRNRRGNWPAVAGRASAEREFQGRKPSQTDGLALGAAAPPAPRAARSFRARAVEAPSRLDARGSGPNLAESLRARLHRLCRGRSLRRPPRLPSNRIHAQWLEDGVPRVKARPTASRPQRPRSRVERAGRSAAPETPAGGAPTASHDGGRGASHRGTRPPHPA